MAVRRLFIVQVRELLHHGATANTADARGRCALHFAALAPAEGIVVELLRQGACANTADRHGGVCKESVVRLL